MTGPDLGSVADELARRGYQAYHEYPGYLAVDLDSGHRLNFGYENDTFGGNMDSPFYDQRGWDSGLESLEAVGQVADLVVRGIAEFGIGRWEE